MNPPDKNARVPERDEILKRAIALIKLRESAFTRSESFAVTTRCIYSGFEGWTAAKLRDFMGLARDAEVAILSCAASSQRHLSCRIARHNGYSSAVLTRQKEVK